MSQKLKTVYIPTKVEDELPEIDKMVFTLNTMIPGKVKYPPEDDGENISVNCRVSEIPNKCEQWYDEHNFNIIYSKVNSWLKPTQLITFTQEEYNKHIQDVIKETLKNVMLRVTPYNEEEYLDTAVKRQQERSYSDNEVIDLLQEMNDWPTTFEGRIDIKEWFNKFKK